MRMKNYLKLFILLASVLFIANCATMNQQLTPGVKVVVSDFDNSIEVIQKPVSSSSKITEGWHTLGFRWNNQAPKHVFLTVGVKGIENISEVDFNIDGKFVSPKTASTITNYSDWSTRQFVMTIDNFKALAKANSVKMKVTIIDKYTVSSFGKNYPNAIINGKFLDFLTQIETNLKK